MTEFSRRSVLAMTVASAALPLAGCGGGPAPTTFDLSAPREGLRRSGGGRNAIVVSEPTTVSTLDSERIVVRAANAELTYLPRAQWSDRLPRLVQTRLIQTFENSGRAAVGRPGDRLAGTYQLLLDIRSFEIRETTRDAFVELAVKLVNASNGAVSNARLFTASAAVGAIDGPGASQALDRALGRVLADITAWASAVG
jgi:cholesterol transport system auxiliary component